MVDMKSIVSILPALITFALIKGCFSFINPTAGSHPTLKRIDENVLRKLGDSSQYMSKVYEHENMKRQLTGLSLKEATEVFFKMGAEGTKYLDDSDLLELHEIKREISDINPKFCAIMYSGTSSKESINIMKSVPKKSRDQMEKYGAIGMIRMLDGKQAIKPRKSLEILFSMLVEKVPDSSLDRFLENLESENLAEEDACWTYKTLIDSSRKLGSRTRADLYRSLFLFSSKN